MPLYDMCPRTNHNMCESLVFYNSRTDHFTFTARCIGYQRKIAIRRDNSGSSPDWYLEELRVRSVVPRGARADMVYVVKRWVPSRGAVYQYNTCESLLPWRDDVTKAKVYVPLHGIIPKQIESETHSCQCLYNF